MKTRRQSTQSSPIASSLRTLFGLAVVGGLTLQMTLGMAAKAQAQIRYTVLKSFGGSDGGFPHAGLVLSGSMLYGTTSGGTSFDGVTLVTVPGTVFKVNTDGTGYTVLKSFTGSGSDGVSPCGLVLSGGTLYGTTSLGGSSSEGTVFKVNTDGTGYTVLKSFTGSGSDAAEPYAGLVLSGGTLYGTTLIGGNVNRGTVFKVNTDGTGYAVLRSFIGSGSDGAYPLAGLVLSGGTLYGTTGGSDNLNNDGTVFKVNTDGTGYTVLRKFTGSDGRSPRTGLVLSGGTLYGTTILGGSSDSGTVFKVNTNGTGYTVLRSFTGSSSDKGWPQADLVLSGGALYGTTWDNGCGGDWDDGTVFKVNTDGTGYTVVKRFSGSITGDGAAPYAPLILSGGTLYGTTFETTGKGGNGDFGTLFRIDLPPTVLTPDGSGSFITNGFGFNLSGMAGQTVVIEASPNLTSWTPLLTNSLLTGYFHYSDPGSTNLPWRFYRARRTP